MILELNCSLAIWHAHLVRSSWLTTKTIKLWHCENGNFVTRTTVSETLHIIPLGILALDSMLYNLIIEYIFYEIEIPITGILNLFRKVNLWRISIGKLSMQSKLPCSLCPVLHSDTKCYQLELRTKLVDSFVSGLTNRLQLAQRQLAP